MGGRQFIDTNVLLYLFDDRAAGKQQRARALVEELGRSGRGALSTQVLLELFHGLTHRLGVSRHSASLMTSAFCQWHVVPGDAPLVLAAMARATGQPCSIGDAMIIESALRCGATILFSEGLQHRQRLGPLTVIDPFRIEAA